MTDNKNNETYDNDDKENKSIVKSEVILMRTI